MSDAISLDLIGSLLCSIQAEQRTLRMENELIRADLSRITAQITTRPEMSEVVRAIADRIGNFKSLMEHRFDQLIAILQSKP